MEGLDVAPPRAGMTVNELGQVGLRHGPELENLLPLGVESRPVAAHRSEGLCPVRFVVRGGSRDRDARVIRLVAPRHDSDPVEVEVKGACDPDRLGRHEVAVAVVFDHPGRARHHREAEGVLCRRDGQGSQPPRLLEQTYEGQGPGGMRGPRLVDLDKPGEELALDVLAVGEPADLEERPLHPPDQVLDRALLLRTVRPAELGGEALVERRLPERRVPLNLLSRAPDHDGLGVVEHRHERHTAEHLEGVKERPYERLDAFVGDDPHVGESRELQPRGEEVEPLLRAVVVSDLDRPEVMLGELPGQALEADQRWRFGRAEHRDKVVCRALAALVAEFVQPAKNLDAQEVGRLVEHPEDLNTEPRRLTRAAGSAHNAQLLLIGVGHGHLLGDALHA